MDADKPQEKLTGGDVNYYLINILNSKVFSPYVIEVEDIIEALDMEFAEGTLFKSLIRLCKLRQNLGKPGSKSKYEAEKIKYYGNRILVKTKRRCRSLSSLLDDEIEDIDYIDIPDPKRLQPYRVYIYDISDALNMTKLEETLLISLIYICKLKCNLSEAIKIKEVANDILSEV